MTVFHKTEPPWWESVKDLPAGAKRRIADGKLASFNGRAYHVYDFREKDGEVYEPQLTLEQKLAVMAELKAAQQAAVQSTEFPGGMPHPQDWPAKARNWLHTASISNEGIQAMGAVWNARMARVVLPLDLLNGQRTWIGRDVGLIADPRSPKYLLPNGMPKGIGARVVGPPSAYPEQYVLTEDYLSAWRVAMDVPGTTGIALLGTSLGRDSLVELVNRLHSSPNTKVIAWLDPDEWGQKGALRIRRDLANLGIPSANIVSEVDPKALDARDLRRFVEDAAWQT